MAALKRSLAQETPAMGATRAKPQKASQLRGRSSAAVIASTHSRRSKKEGGARDRAGRHRPEAAKEGLSAAIKHFCEGDHAGFTERRRLRRCTKDYGPFKALVIPTQLRFFGAAAPPPTRPRRPHSSALVLDPPERALADRRGAPPRWLSGRAIVPDQRPRHSGARSASSPSSASALLRETPSRDAAAVGPPHRDGERENEIVVLAGARVERQVTGRGEFHTEIL